MARSSPADRARLIKRRNRFRALYWAVSLGPPLAVILIGLTWAACVSPSSTT